MKILIVKAVIAWLQRKYPYLIYEAVVPDGKHIGWNPGKKPKVALTATYPKAGE